MNSLPKSRRPRWRYLGVGVEVGAAPDAAPDRRALQSAVWDAATALLGDPGSAAVDPRVVEFSFSPGDETGTAMVRVRRGEVERGRAVLACVAAVDGSPVALRVRGVSGTMRACAARYGED
ncbi:MAG: Rpp14/Pop5 family protein [Haloferacaceae archaeon]